MFIISDNFKYQKKVWLIPFIHLIQPLATWIVEKLGGAATTAELIKEIDAQLKTISQQDEFTQWARLTRKRQALEKMAKKEAEQAAKNAQTIINGVVKVLTIGVMIMYRRFGITMYIVFSI